MRLVHRGVGTYFGYGIDMTYTTYDTDTLYDINVLD